MSSRRTGKSNHVPLDQVAVMLDVPVATAESLVSAGYLRPVGSDHDGGALMFSGSDVKAFVARNADNGSGNLFLSEAPTADAADLLRALDGRALDMARRAHGIFVSVFPEAEGWDGQETARFIEQAKARFEAILAVASQGSEVDEALTDDLLEVGAAAAWAESPLPQLLVLLRISRDLVVQTAVELAEERGRHWSLSLALLLTRILPAMDRLTDSIAQGYWAAVVGREAEHKALYEHVVEHSSDGVYEVDVDGSIQYANPSLAAILGRPLEEMFDKPLGDVIVPVEGSGPLEALLCEPPGGARRVELVVLRTDEVRRVIEIRTSARHHDGLVVGFQGVVRDVTTARDLEADKNEFLSLVTADLRQPLNTILALGTTLETQAPELSEERVRRMGSAVRLQAERLGKLADDLYDISRLEARSLLLSPRAVDLAGCIDSALATLESPEVVHVDIPAGLEVIADPRRLEQVVANLVDNAVEHGSPPVEIRASAVGKDGLVELAVIDHGRGVPSGMVPSLFDRLRRLSHRDRAAARGTGLGLSLVKGLVEAMGGRVWYEQVPSGGGDFRLSLPVPRAGD